MKWRLRQVTALVGDLERAVNEIHTRLGLLVSLRDDGTTAHDHGIANAWVPLGSTIVELASPVRPGDATDRYHTRFGDGGYMIILQTDDFDAARDRLRRLGVRVTREISHPGAQEIHLDHRDVGGTFLAIDWADPVDGWRWAGPDWVSFIRTHVVTELCAAEMTTPDARSVAQQWATLLERTAEPSREGWVIELDRGTLRFVDGEGHGKGRLTAIDVARSPATEPLGAMTLAGLTVRLVEPRSPEHWWA
ncbi:MAG: VOC family protein [Acidimicrobiia bacterium]